MSQTTISRAELLKGVKVSGATENWESSWHETEEWCIAVAKHQCDKCDDDIEVGSLYSIGFRQVAPQDPVRVDGVDRCHFDCTEFGQEHKEDEIYKKHPNLKKTPPCFEGIVMLVTGEFPKEKSTIYALIESNGGIVKDTLGKSHTHMLVGKAGKEGTAKTGTGSKKHTDAVKAGLVPVDFDWCNERIEEWKKTGKIALKAEEEDAKSDESDSSDKKEKAKKTVAKATTKKLPAKKKTEEKSASKSSEEEEEAKVPAKKRGRPPKRKLESGGEESGEETKVAKKNQKPNGWSEKHPHEKYLPKSIPN